MGVIPAPSPACSIVRPVANTAAPAWERPTATPRPTPRLAPVTSATRPFRSAKFAVPPAGVGCLRSDECRPDRADGGSYAFQPRPASERTARVWVERGWEDPPPSKPVVRPSCGGYRIRPVEETTWDWNGGTLALLVAPVARIEVAPRSMAS